MNIFHHVLAKRKLLQTYQLDRCDFGYLGEKFLRDVQHTNKFQHPKLREKIFKGLRRNATSFSIPSSAKRRHGQNNFSTPSSAKRRYGQNKTAVPVSPKVDPTCPYELVLDRSSAIDEMGGVLNEAEGRSCLAWPAESVWAERGYVAGRCAFQRGPPALVHKIDPALTEYFRRWPGCGGVEVA